MTFHLDVPTAVARIRHLDSGLRAYVTTRLDDALAEARALAREPARSPLHGVPYGLKDEWETAGMLTTGGSFRHRARLSATSSSVYEVFRDAGAVLVGKTSLSDMGLAPEASNFLCGETRNPHDRSRTAGGSSGGAAAAVAAGMQAFDWGTDIGGSIRLPAAYCGVVGLKLSTEVWPLTGMFPMPPAGLVFMCGQGPIVQTLAEARAVLDVAAPRLRVGPVRAFSVEGAVLYAPDRLGEWPDFAAEVLPALRAAVAGPVRENGDGALPRSGHVRDVYASVWSSHFEELLDCDPTLGLLEGLGAVLSSVLLRGRTGDRRVHPVTAELLLLIAIGRITLYRDRGRAVERAAAVRRAFQTLWAQGLVVVAPVCVFSPPRPGRSNWNPSLLSCTIAGNLADATGLAIPFGRFASGLPRAIQLLGPPGSEDALLALAERIVPPA